MAKEKKKGFFGEFKEFITRGNVLDMAVGIIIGGAFTAIITALVNGILTPLLQMIGVGDDGFGALQVLLNRAAYEAAPETVTPIILDFGIVISAIVTFLLTALMLFTIVYTVNRIHAHAEKVKAKRAAEEAAANPAPAEPEPAPAPPAPTTEELLAQIVELLKAQQSAGPKE